MDHVLTLIGLSPHLGPPLLDAPLVETVAAALAEKGARVGEPIWLDPGRATDLPYAGVDPSPAEGAARAVLAGRPIDVIAQPAAARRKRLLVADMDATIVTGETLDELAAIAGIGEQVAAITARAMRGEIEFAGALRERVTLLYGLPATVLDQVLPKLELTSGARVLVATMRAHGAYTMLVSGGFGFFTARVRDRCGFDEDQANELEIRAGRLTGRVVEPIRGRAAKLEALVETARRHDIPLELALAVGDGANDLDMLLAAGLGVAFHAKPAVAAAARARIEHGDLTALLFAQGYRREEFAAA